MSIFKVFLFHFLSFIGAISACIGAFSWLSGHGIVTWIIVGGSIVFAGILYSYFQIRPSKSIQLLINNSFPLQIENGDLFAKKGVVIIPVNDYFDTIVDNRIYGAQNEAYRIMEG